jgi:hypothetical protein
MTLTPLNDSALFILKNRTWSYEDLSQVYSTDADYQSFHTFITSYLQNPLSTQDEYNDQCDTQQHGKNSKSLVSRSSGLSTDSKNSPKHIKAISGGKYGCALLAKACGPALLSGLSIGRITALVKHAIKSGVIAHSRTQIVLNVPTSHQFDEGQLQNISLIRRHILSLLREFKKDGITMSQLPFLLKQRFALTLDVKSFGFTKLKLLLQSFLGNLIYFENTSFSGHTKVRLKESLSLELPESPF